MRSFPFFILAAAFANLLGQSESGRKTVVTILAQLPPNVAEVLRAPVAEVLSARTGPLLWIGAIVGLWTVGSFIETIRDILRRAYGVKYCAPFWEYRLASMAMIVGAVFLLMIAFGFSLALSSAQHAIEHWIPIFQNVADALTLYRVVPALVLFINCLLPVLPAHAVAVPAAWLPEMAWGAADHCRGGWLLRSCFPR